LFNRTAKKRAMKIVIGTVVTAKMILFLSAFVTFTSRYILMKLSNPTNLMFFNPDIRSQFVKEMIKEKTMGKARNTT
jgi:hypothetical protein